MSLWIACAFSLGLPLLAFPVGLLSVLLGVGLLDFVLEKLLKLVRVRANNPTPVYK